MKSVVAKYIANNAVKKKERTNENKTMVASCKM